MKACSYCGRQNEDAQEMCTGCGTDLRPPAVLADFKGTLDDAVPVRRCRCGGIMRYYRPASKCSTFFRPYCYRYRCEQCSTLAIVPPYEKRSALKMLTGIGIAALLWICFSETAAEFDRSAWNRRWLIWAMVFAAMGLASSHLLLLGVWNRRRYPITDEPSSPSDQPTTNSSETFQNP